MAKSTPAPKPPPRPATPPTWGALRDAVLAMVTTSVGAAVLAKTGSPELSDASQQFTFEVANVALGAAVGVGVFIRKATWEWIHRRH